jgi:hypothetical protein
VLLEMLDELAVSSRSRRNPRAIKRKMSNWPVRKRGTDGTGKVSLQIDILLTAHPMAKRKPRTQKTAQKDGVGPMPVHPGSSPTHLHCRL